MSVQVYYKATIWGKLEFENFADTNKIIELLETNHSINDLTKDPSLHFNYDEYMCDTEDVLKPEDNDGECTIEILKDNHKLWDNVKEFNVE